MQLDPAQMEDTDRVISRTPIGRAGEPNDISSLLAFLCFPATSYITGQIIALMVDLQSMVTKFHKPRLETIFKVYC